VFSYGIALSKNHPTLKKRQIISDLKEKIKGAQIEVDSQEVRHFEF
jgi:hypothetical protein